MQPAAGHQKPQAIPLGQDAEEVYETDEDVEETAADATEGVENSRSTDDSMRSFRKATPNVVAQMQEIMLQPATSNLYVNRVTSESEEAEVNEINRLDALERRAQSLRKRAEEALGADALQVWLLRTFVSFQFLESTRLVITTKRGWASLWCEKHGSVDLRYMIWSLRPHSAYWAVYEYESPRTTQN